MPTPLSINDIQQLQARLASGDIQGVYTFLLDQGYNYAGWARGVAAGNTIAGEAALDYMKGTALMGVGGLPGQSLSADTIQGIKFDMAKSYLETLSNIADAPENNGYVNRDINAKEVWGFHAKVFRKYNLSIDNWTLNAPFKILQKLGGDAALEEYWAFMRDTKGADSYDTTVANLGTLAFMHKQAASSDPEISSMAQAWMQNVPGIYNGDQVIQSIKLALPFLERQLASSPTPAGLMLRLSILGETLAVPLADKIALSLSSAFNSAQRLSIRRDPLVLDLDGDGLETLGPTQSNVLFDHDADGIKTATGWVKPDDGFLVMDRNNNGVIDNGRELFGDATPLYAGGTAADGFAALAQEDTNGDGRVDNLDANWSKLRVWRDLNQDGVSQSNELLTMGNAGIAGFNVARTINSATLANGNQVADLGMYIKTDGATGTLGGAGQMADVNLAQDSFHSQFTDQIPIDEDVAPLPGMPGSGLVRELRQAASLDTAAGNALKTKLAAFANAQSSAEQQALINDVLLAWADTSPLIATMQNRNPQQVNVVWSSAAQQAEWEGKLHILEAFNGRYFFALPGDTQPGAASGLTLSAPDAQGKRTATVTLFADQVSRLQQSFDTLKASVYGSLVLQTRLKPLLDKIQVGIDNDGAHLDFSQLDSELNARVASNAVNGVADWIDLAKYGQSTFAGTGYDAWGTLKTALFSGAIAADTLNALHIQVGTAGNDTVTGAATDNLLFAGAGDDKLYGNNGADVLAGGAGNDVLYGGIGSDTYLFNLGDGQDTIQENANEGLDLLRLGVGLDAASTQIVRENMDLVLVFNANDKVRISNYFNGNSVDLIGFADGTVWDYTAVAEKVIYTGTANADYLYGVNDVANRIYGLDGNDQIYGGTNSDRLDGGAGNDYLEGGSGNDTLTGGTGNDTLVGGYGSDTFVYRRGDGQDTISNNSGQKTGGDIDTLQFADMTAADLTLERSGNDLVFKVNGSSDWVKVSGMLGGGNVNSLNQVQFADGTVWNQTALFAQTITGYGTAGGDYIVGYNEGPNISYGLDGNDTIYGANQNDVLSGGTGNDYLEGGSGNDALTGGTGNDTLVGGYGSDTFVYRRGDGQDTISNNSGQKTAGDIDTLQFADMTAADLTLERSGNDLVFKVNGSSDWVKVSGMLGGGNVNSLNQVQFADGTVWNQAALFAQPITGYGTAGGDYIVGYNEGQNISYGLDGNDQIYGGTNSDRLDGGAGNDYLEGGSGNDTLTGGTGNDTLVGGYGSDTFVYRRGDGQDTISNNSSQKNAGDIDTLQFADLTAADLTLERSGNDLVFKVNGSSDWVKVSGMLGGGNVNSLNQVQFADGTVWNQTALFAQTITGYGTAGGDYIVGYNEGPNISYGLDGNDTIYGANQNDVLSGGTGNDYLEGGSGNDALTGGTGNDTLVGGYGSDTFVYRRGDGQDTISNNSGQKTAGDIDTLQFADMTAADLTLERSGNDLVFKVNGSSDWVKVSGMLGGGNVNSLNQVQFADGTVWNQTALFAQTITGYGTAGGDYIVGYNEGPNISYGLDGNDQIYGGTNSDRLDGGTGNDYLEGGSGNDTLTGGTGNDTLSGGTGSDTYVFGRGDGADIISESDSTAGNTDVAQFGTNIAADQLWFQHAGSNLEVSVIGTSDKLTIQNWYSGASYHVEQFRTAGGKLLLDSQVENLVSAMAAFAPPSAGQTTLPQAYQDELAPKIAANWQ